MTDFVRTSVDVASVHVVRRYGPVGGMERYVWEVTRALAASGLRVTVVCERCHAERPPGIEVHELGEVAPRPRWLSLLRFSRRVAAWLRERPQSGALIHSHERLGVHHVTTFHGPPFATIRERGWWRRVSLRVAMQLHLERRELFAPTLRAIVPNSPLIRDQLLRYYPDAATRMHAPIAPGVAAGPPRPPRRVPTDGGVIGFIGKEWKRKGLVHAAVVVAEMRRHRPQLQLWVAGPAPEELGDLFAGWGHGVRLLGWIDPASIYPHIDLLLHPARDEPFGMVITEALSTGVPVVISDRCGAASELPIDSGEVLALDARIEQWAAACSRQLDRSTSPPPYRRSWRNLATEYAVLYQQLCQADPSG
jgi:UDP-glucose:(heptosyl)LPS alpha-1,3-glucosyltransferase